MSFRDMVHKVTDNFGPRVEVKATNPDGSADDKTLDRAVEVLSERHTVSERKEKNGNRYLFARPNKKLP